MTRPNSRRKKKENEKKKDIWHGLAYLYIPKHGYGNSNSDKISPRFFEDTFC